MKSGNRTEIKLKLSPGDMVAMRQRPHLMTTEEYISFCEEVARLAPSTRPKRSKTTGRRFTLK